MMVILRQQSVRLTAIAIVFLLYSFARLPQLNSSERSALAANFRFTALTLPELSEYPMHAVRPVHPSLNRIAAWISSVGASVAIGDVDKDGLANDVCHVDVRINQVIVAPAPGTATRYEPFVLTPAPLPYDAAAMAPTGCLIGDFNEDGRTDFLVYYWGRTPVVFLNRAEPTQTLQAESYHPHELTARGERWYTNAATLADLDGDGHVDLAIGNYFQDNALILDADADNQEEMQHSMSRAFNGGRNRFFLWKSANQGAEPGVQFQEVEAGLPDEVTHGWTLALGAADLDGDLLPELYFANDFGPDRLLHNRSGPGQLAFALLEGQKHLTTPRSKVLGQDSFKGMGVDFSDINGDGLLDIYVSNIAADYSLHESHFVFVSTGQLQRMVEGIAPYDDHSEPLGLSRSGWSWESRLGDFNNDGVLEALQATGFVKGDTNRWPELHELAMGNDEMLRHPQSWPLFQPGDDLSGHQHNPFFVRAADGRYYDLAPELGLDAPQVSRGIATADVDGDGDLDFAVANQWETSTFYRNECPRCASFLGLHLLLPVDNASPAETILQPGHPDNTVLARPAIGATAVVHLPDGHQLAAQVDGGNGHSGARSPDLHFGLGNIPANARLQVDLSWRDTAGLVHHQTHYLSPGWHTLLLGQS